MKPLLALAALAACSTSFLLAGDTGGPSSGGTRAAVVETPGASAPGNQESK